MVFAPARCYDRIQAIVAHMGHDGFTPYEMLHTYGLHYEYNEDMLPVRLPRPY